MRVLVSGSSGFIGSSLASFLRNKGWDVVRLVRAKSALAADAIFWDPLTGEIDKSQFEGFDAIIHLAGANIAKQRWSKERKAELMRSRCRDTWLLSQVLCRLYRPPKTLLCASAVGYYGDRGFEKLTEESCKGEGFLSDLCALWEEGSEAIAQRGTRVVHMRFGSVLSPQGGMLKQMLPPFRWGLGVKMGSGKQFMSWIALSDLLHVITYLLDNPKIEGAVNCVAPHPVTQGEFAQILAKELHHPCRITMPPLLVRVLFGQMGSDLLLASQRVYPDKLISGGFSFDYPALKRAQAHELHPAGV